MNDLPLAALLSTELVRRQFRSGESDAVALPARPAAQPIRWTRAALAGAFEWAARLVAPSGYHLAH